MLCARPVFCINPMHEIDAFPETSSRWFFGSLPPSSPAARSWNDRASMSHCRTLTDPLLTLFCLHSYTRRRRRLCLMNLGHICCSRAQRIAYYLAPYTRQLQISMCPFTFFLFSLSPGSQFRSQPRRPCLQKNLNFQCYAWHTPYFAESSPRDSPISSQRT